MGKGRSPAGQAAKRLESHLGDLGPHASLLLGEALAAMRAGNRASVVVLAAAVLDVALREPSGIHSRAGGPALATARDSRDAYWLRERRNGIVHYEGGRGGLMGEGDGVLGDDAERAASVLADALGTLAGG